MSETEEAGSRRGRNRVEGGRSARGQARQVLPQQRPSAQPHMRYKPTEVLSPEGVEAIHDASMRILEEMGMDFLDPDARALLRKAGARVEDGSNRVRFERDMVGRNRFSACHSDASSASERQNDVARPARNAAPREVVSVTVGRTTGTPRMSAWN